MKTYTPKIVSTTFVITLCLLFMQTSVFAVAKAWIGSGSGGAGTDFNTGANWSPVGVPGAADDVTIAMTTTGNCNLSANATVNNFTFTVANSSTGKFDVGTKIITINGTTIMNGISYSNPVSYSYLEFNVESTGAGAVFNGPVTVHTTGAGLSIVNAAATNPGSCTFNSDLTVGTAGRTLAGTEPKLIFDAPVSQTINVNNTTTYFLGENVIFGLVNSPTITFASTVNPQWFGVYDGGAQINNSTIVKAMNNNIPRINSGGAGTFAMAAGSRLEINFTHPFPGQDFANVYPTYSLNATSTTIYLGAASAQTVTGLTYGHLISGGSGNKTAGGTITVQGNFTIQSGSTYLGSTFTHNLHGDYTNSGTFTANTSTFIFDGTIAQNVFGTTSSTFYNLTSNNTSATGTTLNIPTSVSHTLTLTDGYVYTDATNLMIVLNAATATSGSAVSFVDGPLKKIGNQAFTFPVGNQTYWARIGMTAPSLATDAFTATYHNAPYASLTPVTAPLAYVSSVEHWVLDRTTGTSNIKVTLFWESGARSGINTFTSDLRVGHYTSANTWVDEGNGSMTGAVAAGSITTAAAVTSFSPFTFASLTPSTLTNPLPIELLSFQAIPNNTQVDLSWATASETNNNYFVVEKSKDAQNFESIDKLKGAGNSTSVIDYFDKDYSPFEGISYYRLKQTDFNGKSSYSNIVPVEFNPNGGAGISIFPNPSDMGTSTYLSLSSLKGQEVLVVLRDITGKEIFSKVVIISSDSEIVAIDQEGKLAKGMYLITASSINKLYSKKLIVK